MVRASELQLGREVDGSDGEKIGSINEVVEDPSSEEPSRGEYYMVVDQGGFLGFGASHLHIPVSAVQEIERGGALGIGSKPIVLNCTGEEARTKYQVKPK